MTISMTDAKSTSSSFLPPRYFSFPAIKGQNPWLDLLRAFAVTFVLLRHGERALANSSLEASYGFADKILNTIFINGWVGVDLFLILSGYLIGKSLIKKFHKDNRINIGTFFRARALRIVPAYFAVLFITALGLFPLYSFSSENIGLRIFYHMLFLQDYLPSDINVVFWSLGVEEKFYILAPLIAFTLVKLKHMRAALGMMLILFLSAPLFKALQFSGVSTALDYQTFFENYRSPFHLSTESLIIGFAISYFEVKQVIKVKPLYAKWIFTIVACASVGLMASHNFLAEFGYWDMIGQPITLALLFGLLVLCATQLAQIHLWGEALWRVMSRLSYALYLIHFPLIPLSLALTPTETPLLFWAIYLSLVITSAMILHFTVEKPFLIIKDRKAPKLVLSR